MKLPIGYRRVARTEYDEAAVWYESEQKGLGDDLVAEIQENLDVIAEHPTRFPLIGRGIRQAILNRFPYSIFYRIQPERIMVVAVFHHSRKPADWQSRS